MTVTVDNDARRQVMGYEKANLGKTIITGSSATMFPEEALTGYQNWR
jgi:hypothetical protein